MAKMTQQALEIRNSRLEDAMQEHGRDTVMAWADDPVKVRILNALAQIEADDRN